ncbi:hypothetical protein [Duganella sp. HH105]|uniref:hypothetical protein n=1 Tax=Duganella sp. HH105 TaxID=1781067 RepID=UPI0009003EE4|nr:hypothetical protein [Duganella sp. HH105]
MNTPIDLEIALTHMHQLQLENGDLGAQYWYEISCLLQEAAMYKERALAAEAKLAEVERSSKSTYNIKQ